MTAAVAEMCAVGNALLIPVDAKGAADLITIVIAGMPVGPWTDHEVDEAMMRVAEGIAIGFADQAFALVSEAILRGGPEVDVKLYAASTIIRASHEMAAAGEAAADVAGWEASQRDELYRRRKHVFDRRLNELAASEWSQPKGFHHAAE